MATVILTTVGSAIGGPIGASIGAFVGQAIDARLFAPKGRNGPRLDELRVQTSSYGVPVPRLYGRMRVAGTVIWATDLVEHRNRQSNGKGRGSTTTYSYSVSMAVALSSRPMLSVARIWAEGNILRGDDGMFKSPTTFRFHQGGEDQAVDPLIAAAEVAGGAPAFRGIAYAVFEDFDLAPFGNRIPSLTFEVEADEGALTLADPLRDILGHAQSAASARSIIGCAIAAESRDAATVMFDRLVPVSRRPGDHQWTMGVDRSTEPLVLSAAVQGKRDRQLAADEAIPRQISVSAYDPARDFQVGEQSARVAGGSAPAERLALPLALRADDAKRLAVDLATEAAVKRQLYHWPQGFAALALLPTMRVVLPGRNAPLVIDERTIDGAGVSLSLSDDRLSPAAAIDADSGRALISPDLALGVTTAALFDVPAATTADLENGRLLVAAMGGAGWRGAAIRIRPAAGAPLIDLGYIRPAAVLGTVESISSPRSFATIDRADQIVVALHPHSMALVNASDPDLIAGANLAVIGQEVIQFGNAEPLGGGRWRLTRLLRGRLGSEDRAASTSPGMRFALLDDPALMAVPPHIGLATIAAGGSIAVQAVGDNEPVVLTIAHYGRAAQPLAPVHLKAIWQADGGLVLGWIRRSRTGFAWNDGVDAPLDARMEQYRVTWSAGTMTGIDNAAQPQLTISAAMIDSMRSAAATLLVSVVQVGDVALSPPAETLVVLD